MVGVVAMAWSFTASAQFGSQVLRAQTSMTERAITRNLEHAFRPRLVVTRGATGPVTALALSGDEHRLVTAVGNNSLRVWDLWAGRELARLSGHQARITFIAIANDGSVAASADTSGAVKLWNLNRLGEASDLPKPPASVMAMAFLASGKSLAMAGADGHIRVWSMAANRLEADIPAHGEGLTLVAALPDATRVASAGADGKVVVWDIATGNRVAQMDCGEAVTTLAASADGSVLAAGTRGGDISVFAADGRKVSTLSGWSRVAGIALSAHGEWLLAGGGDGAVKLYDPRKTDDPKVFGKHESSTTFVAVSHDGAMAVSGSEDGTTRLWNMASGALLLRLISTEDGWAVVDSKGRYDGSETALEGIEWQAEEASANIEDFAETHYQAALLPRTLHGERDIPDATSIPEGVRYPAVVRFLSPTSSGPTAKGRVKVEVVAEDKGGGASEIRLYRNGKLVSGEAGQMSREERNGRARLVGTYDIDVSGGQTKLSAVAVNAQRLESRTDTIILDTGEPDLSAGKMHLVMVGVNAYAQSKLNLDYAKPDAEAIAAFLARSGRTALPVAEITTLFDQNATKANILATLRRFRQLPPEDVIVLYMAGHGISVGDEWYFVPHDALTPNRAETLPRDAVSSQELRDEMAASAAERSLLLLDTCHSGTAVSPLNDYRGLKSLRLLARGVGTHVLAATDRTQSALEIESLGHGIFTYVLLQGLDGRASARGTGLISATDIIRYVEGHVPALAKQMADDVQYPSGYSRGVDFAVATRSKDAKP
jgi:hypothetical protein